MDFEIARSLGAQMRRNGTSPFCAAYGVAAQSRQRQFRDNISDARFAKWTRRRALAWFAAFRPDRGVRVGQLTPQRVLCG
eukprot:5353983-Alexandrium_andersonii.AAC.1